MFIFKFFVEILVAQKLDLISRRNFLVEILILVAPKNSYVVSSFRSPPPLIQTTTSCLLVAKNGFLVPVATATNLNALIQTHIEPLETFTGNCK
jgi:hypothetical protein